MHHPDICDIILVIEDYFLVSNDVQSKCQIEAIIDESDEYQPKRGIKISRKLLNGYIHADIWEMDRDNDTVNLKYSVNSDFNSWVDSIDIECCDYSPEAVRTAVRSILKFDKNKSMSL